MKKIAIVSSLYKCNEVEEDIWIKDKLIELGYKVDIIPWEDKKINWSKYDLIIIKSTWKYNKKINEFINWLDKIKKYNVINSINLINENLYKDKQISKLDKANLPHINTLVGTNIFDTTIKMLYYKIKYGKVVIKPSISAGGDNTFLYITKGKENYNNTCNFIDAIKNIRNILKIEKEKILIQEYIDEITNGEISLVFVNGEYQYALEKHPKVFHNRIPTDIKRSVNKDIIEFGKKAISKLKYDNTLFARIDLVVKDNKPIIMEIEVIEPYLYMKKLDSNKRQKVITKFVDGIIERI